LEEKKQSNVSFDDYIETYQKEVQGSIDFIGQDVDFFIKLKADLLVEIARKCFDNINGINVLDIGSGIGLTDHFLIREFKNLFGVDIEEGILKKAAAYNPDVKYQIYDGKRLPFENNTMNIAFAMNVMHHVPPEYWENFAKEMYRVLKPNGIAAVFEHNPVNPLTRRAVRDCEFDKDAVLLNHGKIKTLFKNAGLKINSDAFIVFFPFKSKVFRTIEKGLGWLPLGAQQYVIGKKN
jgi:SAM-dependent methyltransferase